jgi:Nif-specific regulatory protein
MGASSVPSSEPTDSGGDRLPQQKLARVLRLCQQMNSLHDLPRLLELIVAEAAGLVGADRATLFLVDRVRGELCSTVALGTQEPLRFDARLGVAGAVVQSGHTICVQNAGNDERFYAGVDGLTGYRTRNLVAVPLSTPRGEIVGVFEVLNKKRGPFSDEDVELAKAFGAQAAVAIETTRLLAELKRDRSHLERENTQLRREVEGRLATQNILGTSERVQRVLRLIEQISDSSVNVLITGESGTGKELAARAIHHSSPRVRGPFVALNCAALPENLVEAELFGIEKGVATGVAGRAGLFEEAHGGTLFLDEIGDLSLVAQAKILRALQERQIQRVGGRKSIAVDVRMLAATNKDLESAIAEGKFRDDLYYRLKVIHIQMPALREIPDDIPLLVNHFFALYCREMDRPPGELSAGALRCLANYDWPGNVRQLQNEMKRLAVSVRKRTLGEADLSDAIRSNPRGHSAWRTGAAPSLKDEVTALEKRLIDEALCRCGRNQMQAARKLGISRQGMIKKMKRYGIRP